MENFPLFATTILLGNMMGLEKGDMERFAGTYLVLRAAYAVQFIATSRQRYTVVRSGLWLSSVVLCLRTMIKAARH